MKCSLSSGFFLGNKIIFQVKTGLVQCVLS